MNWPWRMPRDLPWATPYPLPRDTSDALLAEGHCPACPGTERLQPGTTVLVGRQHSTGRCPCCAAVWITDDEHGWTCLDTGKLICTHAT